MSLFLDLHREMVEGTPPRLAAVFLMWLFAPISWLYGLVSRFRVFLFKSGLRRAYRSRVTVVSVGNVAVGGTGKTPMVDFLIRFWLEQGKRVAVVSRGYKGKGEGEVQQVAVDSSPLAVGDEPLLLARRNPRARILVAKKRRHGIEFAVAQYGAEVVILDDGFQHVQVHRDLDIVLLDANRPFGNGLPLPAGNLREFPSALRRCDLVIHTRCGDQSPQIPFFGGPQFYSNHKLERTAVSLGGSRFPLNELQGKKIIVFAGIANPESFFQALNEFGLKPSLTIPLPDHARYGDKLLAYLVESAKGADYLLTTEKDGVKLKEDDFPIPCLTVGMACELGSSREPLIDLLSKVEV